MHLAVIHKLVERVRAAAVIVDPISNFIDRHRGRAQAMLLRLIDFLKAAGSPPCSPA